MLGKWILHYYGDVPWRSISDLDACRGNELAARSGKTYGGSYRQHRRAIEQWDRDQHLARGGIVQNDNPVYAVLCDTIPDIHPHYGAWLALPAAMIPAHLISLTLGDSFIVYDLAQAQKRRSWPVRAIMERR